MWHQDRTRQQDPPPSQPGQQYYAQHYAQPAYGAPPGYPPPPYGYPPPGYPPPYGYPPPGYGPPQGDPAHAPHQALPPSQGPAPQSAEPAPQSAAPAPEPAPPPPSAPVQPEELLSDEELNEMLGPEEDPDTSASLTPQSREEITEIDEEAVESLPDPDPIESWNDAEEDETGADLEPDDIPDPDPIPEVFSEPVTIVGAQEKSRTGLWVSLSAVAAVVLVLVGLVVARGPITAMIPGMAGLYELVGLGEPIGAGLQFQKVSSERLSEGENDIIQVTGTITNASEGLKIVPVIRISLIDAADREVQFVNILPAQEDLAPGESFEFSGRIPNPAPTARRVDVSFTEEGATQPPGTAMGGQPADQASQNN